MTGFADRQQPTLNVSVFGVAGYGGCSGNKRTGQPARDMEAALAEVSSLDVANKTLDSAA
ncbi:hypothetical protein [Shigella boydii]|uniref:hypothetical protein n=1 Tax=Shigella boydii TaxID=621 RepID=UPI0025403F2D|nr:hypothetical protein [Shigella boydii]